MTWQELVAVEPRLERIAARARMAGLKLRYAGADEAATACGWERFVATIVMAFVGPDIIGTIPAVMFSEKALRCAYEHIRGVFKGEIDDGVDEFEELRQRVAQKINAGAVNHDDPDLAAFMRHAKSGYRTV